MALANTNPSDILEEDMGPDSDDESEVSDQADEKERRQRAMDQLVPPLEPGVYGQMPTSYSNSQAVKPSTLETETHIPEDTDMPSLDEPTSQASKTSIAEVYKTSTSTARDSDQQSEQKRREKPFRRPLLPRDRYDGVDSDDDTDPEDMETAINNGLPDDDESEEDRPTVVGEVEIDMNDEQEEFIKFSREALGIDDALWSKIMEERAHRGGKHAYAIYVRTLIRYMRSICANESIKATHIRCYYECSDSNRREPF